MEKIPNGIWKLIVDFITSPKDLKSLCLVNKLFNIFARRLLWRNSTLKLSSKSFTLDNFKEISKTPLQILDVSELVISEHKLDGTNWIGHYGRLENEFHNPSLIDLFKMIGQMEHLSKLKIDLTFIDVNEQCWSNLLVSCAIKTLVIGSGALNDWRELSLTDLSLFSRKHLHNFPLLELLVFEPSIVHFDDYVGEASFPEFSQLKSLSLGVRNIKIENYVDLFQTIGSFHGLRTLELYLYLDIDEKCKSLFFKAKSDFMTNHPQCEVWMYADIEDSFGNMESWRFNPDSDDDNDDV